MIRFFSIILVIVSCSSNHSCSLEASVHNQGIGVEEEFIVSFDSTFNFEWTNLYIVDSWIHPKEISDAIGVKYQDDIVLDGESLFIFMNKGEIVLKERLTSPNLMFPKMKKDGIVCLKKGNIYNAKQKIINNTIYYIIAECE